MEETESMTAGQIANHIFAYLRRIESQLKSVTEVLLRHETRLGRIERDLGDVRRDLGEVRSDIVLVENQMLNRMNEILDVVRRLDEHSHRISMLETPNTVGS